jgi:putative nucleotidyltransferase with HDIG domain
VSTPNIQDAVARIETLPTLPAVLVHIIEARADPDASAIDLGRHIASDQSLTAVLLKVVNSAYYGHYRRIDSVTAAIVMLGFHEVRNLALAASTFRTLPQGHHDFDRTQLWRHSLAAAVAAERLAKALGIPLDGCFVSGLLHDIGKVVLDVLYPGSFRCAVHQAQIEKRRLYETEIEVFTFNHAEAGALLAERWNLPPKVVEAIRLHHDLESCPPESLLPKLAAMANYAAYQAGVGESSNGCEPVFPEAAAAPLRVDLEYVQYFGEELRHFRPQLDEFLGALPK